MKQRGRGKSVATPYLHRFINTFSHIINGTSLYSNLLSIKKYVDKSFLFSNPKEKIKKVEL
jgi:hypothetical protein